MTDPSERELTALHEAGHQVVAALYGWALGAVTITPGKMLAGCSLATPPLAAVTGEGGYDREPFICWPATVRRRMEGEAVMLIAGDLAELLFAPRTGRRAEPAAVLGAGIVVQAAVEPAVEPASPLTLPAATAAERTAAAEACDDEAIPSDADAIARLARFAHWDDPWAAEAWILYLNTQARALLLAHEARVRRLAAALLADGTVGAEAAVRLLA